VFVEGLPALAVTFFLLAPRHGAMQRDAVEPRRDRGLRAEIRDGVPDLWGDLPKQIVAVVRREGVGADDLEQQAAMPREPSVEDLLLLALRHGGRSHQPN
jgi:hypothetical protein